MISRRIQALQRLAERPGTEAEGDLARSFLALLAEKHDIRIPDRFVSDEDLRLKFPKGTCVYYNYWCYDPNARGYVAGYSKKSGWIRIKFDHMGTVRSVPIYTARGGCHLSTEPARLSDALDMIHVDNPNWRENIIRAVEAIGLGNISIERRQAMIDQYSAMPGMDAVLVSLGKVAGHLDG